jgi:starvation-inducible outer membrane lipoprotein
MNRILRPLAALAVALSLAACASAPPPVDNPPPPPKRHYDAKTQLETGKTQ